MAGTLYIVSTPIGNLDDITFRALNVLKTVSLIACEDTRHTLKLLNHFEISKPLFSYHRHNEKDKLDFVIEKLNSGEDIALVSDAGTPIISDPGNILVTEAVKHNINIVSIPGPCALITALTYSNLDTSEFSFIGFLPTNKKLQKEKLSSLLFEERLLIFYEAPHKLKSTLQNLLEVLGDRKIVIARELTKLHEEIFRGNVVDAIEKFQEPKGEFVIILEGTIKKDNSEKELSLDELYKFYENTGLSKKEIVKQIAKDKGLPKNDVYKHFLN